MKKIITITLATMTILGGMAIGQIENIKTNQFGVMIEFKDNTGYWIEK